MHLEDLDESSTFFIFLDVFSVTVLGRRLVVWKHLIAYSSFCSWDTSKSWSASLTVSFKNYYKNFGELNFWAYFTHEGDDTFVVVFYFFVDHFWFLIMSCGKSLLFFNFIFFNQTRFNQFLKRFIFKELFSPINVKHFLFN